MGVLKIATIKCNINMSGKILVPDEDGFYYVNLGALNVSNTSGIFYRGDTSVLDLFTNKSSTINKRIAGKKLFGEYKHPKLTEEFKRQIANGNTKPWILRNLDLDDDRFSHQIKSVDLFEDSAVIDKITNKKKVLIKGYVRPYGPYGHIVEDAFKNKHTSASFSIRVIMRDEVINGRIERVILIVSTWDYVNSPGISGSTDQHSVGSEIDISDVMDLEDFIDSDEYTASEDDREMIKECISTMSDSLVTKKVKNKLIKEW